MKTLLYTLFVLFSFVSFSQAQSEAYVTRVPDALAVADIIYTDNELFYLYIVEGNKLVLSRCDADSIYVTVKEYNYVAESLIREKPSFVRSNTEDNFYVVIPQEGGSTLIEKFDANQESLWEYKIDGSNQAKHSVSSGIEKGDSLILVGGIVDESFSLISSALVLTASDGKKLEDWFGEKQNDREAFFTSVINVDNNLVILEPGYNEDTGYSTYVYGLYEDSLSLGVNLKLSSNFLALDIKERDGDLLIFGAQNGVATYYVYNAEGQAVTHEVEIYDAFDDYPIEGYVVGDSIVTIHTTWPRGNDVVGSGVETMLTIFDGNHNKVETLISNSDASDETQCWGSDKKGNLLYFGGLISSDRATDPEGIAGYFTLPVTTSSRFLQREYENLVYENGEVKFGDESLITRAFWYDIQGRLIESREVNAPYLSVGHRVSAPYVLVLESDKGKGVIRLSQR